MNKELQKLIDQGLLKKASELDQPEKIPTGSLMLDYLLDGGIPTRRISEFFSKEGTGKSVQAYHCINNALKMYPDKIALLVDTEQRADINWISNFVEDIDRLYVMQPEYIEDVTDNIRELVNQGIGISLIVIDSIGAANTYRSADKSSKVMQVGGNAMGVGVFSRAMAPIANKNNIAVLCINQLRDDIASFVPSIGHTPGGRALKHALDLDIYMRKTSNKATIKDENGETLIVGNEIAFKIMKGKNQSKVIKTFFYSKPSELGDLGFDRFSEIVNLSVSLNIINKAAASYSYEDFPDGKIRGLDNVKTFLKENEEIYHNLEQKIYQQLDVANHIVESEELDAVGEVISDDIADEEVSIEVTNENGKE